MDAVVLLLSLLSIATGLSQGSDNNDVGVFWHFTDTHLYPEYKAGTSATVGFCRTLVGFAGKYGHYDCDSPVSLMNVITDALINKTVEPDFILYGGDHISIFHTPQNKAMVNDMLENVTAYMRAIKAAHPKTRIFPILGNHDVVPQFQFPEKGPFYVYSKSAELWSSFVSAESVKMLNQSSFYTELITKGLRLVALNTVIYYPENKKVSTKTVDPAGQFAWLRNVLENARKQKERVIITAHIPPGLCEASHVKEFNDEFATAFVEALDGYNDIIVGSFYGHNHLESLRVFRDTKNGNGTHIGFLTSSVTPKYKVNPSVTLYKYKKTYPFTILDRIPYYVDLEKTDKSKTLQWVCGGSEAAEFGVSDMGSETMVNVIAKMSNDEALFRKLYNRMHMFHNEDKKCNKNCRDTFLCIVNNPDNKLAKKCMKGKEN